MSKMFNRARMTITSTGTGALTLGVAVTGYQTFSSAGVSNGDTVSYTIEDGVNWECGTGIFTLSGTTLSRTVTQSYNGTTYGSSPISVTTSAQVFITALAADLTSTDNLTSGTLPVARGGTGLSTLTSGNIPYATATNTLGTNANFTYDGTNFTVGGTAARILGDFSNATLANRLFFQSNVTNGVTSLSAIPNGTSTQSEMRFYNGTDPNNASYARLTVGGAGNTLTILQSSFNGTGSTLPLAFYVGGSEAMRITSAGLVGIGTTGPAYALDVQSSTGVIQVKSTTGTNATYFAFNNTSGQNLIGNESSTGGTLFVGGSAYSLSLGTVGAYPLQLATNNNVRATLDASGNLGLGTTPSAWRSGAKAFQSGGNGYLALWEQANGSVNLSFAAYEGSANTFNYRTTGDAPTLYSQVSGAHRWYYAAAGTQGNSFSFTQAMTLDASGNLGIGETSPSTYGQLVVKGGSSSATSPVLALVANSFLGADGPALDFARAGFTQPIQARIRTEDDGTASSNLSFWTKNTGTAGTLTRRMTLDASGNLAVGGSTANSRLDVQGGYLRVNEDGVGTKVITLRSNYASVAPAINVTTNDPLLLMTNNTERARIDTNGTLLVGQTTNPATSSVVIKVVTGTGNGVNAQITSNTGTSYPWSNYNASGTYVGGISCTSSATAFPTSSDERLKSNIVDAENTLTTLLSIKVRSFNWKIDNSHQDYGVIAQEVAPLVPEAVLVSPGPDDYLSVDYSRFVPRLVKAIQELAAKVQALEAKVA